MEITTQRFGFRDETGRYLRVREETAYDYRDEGFPVYTLIAPKDAYSSDEIFKGEDYVDLLSLCDFKREKINSDRDRPSNEQIFDRLRSFDKVIFRETNVFDFEGGDPVQVTETVERLLDPKFLTGIKLSARQVTELGQKGVRHFADVHDRENKRHKAHQEAMYLDTLFFACEMPPEKDMMYFDPQHARQQVVDAIAVGQLDGTPVYAVLLNCNHTLMTPPESVPFDSPVIGLKR